MLYELSVVCSIVVFRRKQRREEARLAEEAAAGTGAVA